MPIIGSWSGNKYGVTFKEALFDPDLQSNCLIKSLKEFKYDGTFTYMDLTVETEALGAKIDYPENEPPTVSRHPLSDKKRPSSLKSRNVKDTRLKKFLKVTKNLIGRIGEKYFVAPLVIGPFTLTGELLGVNSLLEYTIDDPGYIKECLTYTTSFIKEYVNPLARLEPDSIVILEPTATTDIISPHFFDKYVAPCLKDLHKIIRKANIFPTLHICGNTTPILKKMEETKPTLISLDSEVNMFEAKERIGDNVALMGNISPSETLLQGEPFDVRNACENLVNSLDGNGFILSSGCEIMPRTPAANIQEMVKAVK